MKINYGGAKLIMFQKIKMVIFIQNLKLSRFLGSHWKDYNNVNGKSFAQ